MSPRPPATLGVIASVVVLSAALTATQGTELLLDVSGAPAPRTPTGPVARLDVDRVSAPWPIDAELVSLDKPEYRLNDKVIFEVLLTAHKPVAMPWSSDCDRFEPKLGVESPKDLRMVAVGLAIDYGDRLGAGLAVQTLCGTLNEPTTMKSLKAGDRARLRLVDRWRVDWNQRSLTKETIAVKAILRFREGGSMLEASLISTKPLRVDVR